MKMICDVPDEVIKSIKDGTYCGSFMVEKMIAKGIPLSSSENPNRWIPVSERLPEKGIDVLMCDMEGIMYLSHRSSSNHYYDEWGNKIKDIRAWMPLPEPYKASPTGAEGRNKE